MLTKYKKRTIFITAYYDNNRRHSMQDYYAMDQDFEPEIIATEMVSLLY